MCCFLFNLHPARVGAGIIWAGHLRLGLESFSMFSLKESTQREALTLRLKLDLQSTVSFQQDLLWLQKMWQIVTGPKSKDSSFQHLLNPAAVESSDMWFNLTLNFLSVVLISCSCWLLCVCRNKVCLTARIRTSHKYPESRSCYPAAGRFTGNTPVQAMWHHADLTLTSLISRNQ